MSIEALVAEVRPTITNHAALAAADQLYFGDRRAASDAKPETSHGHHRGHSHTNHGKNHSGDKVKQAIHDAKATLNKTGNNRHRGASHQESQEVAALRSEVAALKLETTTLKKQFAELREYVSKIGAGAGTNGVAPETTAVPEEASASKDDDFDLFGSEDEDDEEKKRITEERLKAYAEKKAKKGPGPVAKSNIIFDVKPWDDTIDIKEIEKNVREITTDGLVWGASKILPVAFGINKLQIMCVVEDAKVSTDWLEEQITGIEDLVQSIDVVAFNKV